MVLFKHTIWYNSIKWTRLESVATNGPAAVQDISVALSFSIPAKPLHRPFMSRCYAVKIKLWGVHRPARVSEGIRWLLLWRVRPPALTEADARQVTVLMGR